MVTPCGAPAQDPTISLHWKFGTTETMYYDDFAQLESAFQALDEDDVSEDTEYVKLH